MTPYELGFADGERLRCEDKKIGRFRVRPHGSMHERGRGFWDGYTPRSQTWALRATPARSFHEANDRCA